MKKQKREYPEEFKEQAINLTTDRSASDIERELN
jgi:transposase-like protein